MPATEPTPALDLGTDAPPARHDFTWVDALLLAGIVALSAAAGTPWLLHSRKNANESAATGALKTIATAQSVFREGDKEQDGNLDYGMLTELSNVALIDAAVGRGNKKGYLFEATYSYATSEFLWFAVANPRVPTVTGDRYWETNAAGVLFYTTGGHLLLDTSSCTIAYSQGMIPCCK